MYSEFGSYLLAKKEPAVVDGRGAPAATDGRLSTMLRRDYRSAGNCSGMWAGGGLGVALSLEENPVPLEPINGMSRPGAHYCRRTT